MRFKEFLNEKDNLKNAKISYTKLGSSDSKGEFSWNMNKKNILIKDIKKRKKIKAFRTFSLSEKKWNEYFETGYTEIGNENLEKGLTSFTIEKKMLGRFRGGNDITIVIEVELNKYSEILQDSAYPEEKELLGNDVKWVVTGLDDDNDNWYIIGKQIG